MPLKIPEEGEIELLDKMLKDALTTDENLTLHLYKNNYTPVDASTLTSFTEATFTGYSPVTLTRAGFGAATTVSGKAQSSYATQTFTLSGGSSQEVFGYYVVGATSGKVLWAERFDASKTLDPPSDELDVTPRFSFNSES